MSAADNPLEAAACRLSDAVGRLERRLAEAATVDPAQDLFADDRAALTSALRRERARTRELETAAADASAALGRAVAEIRAAVSEPVGEEA